MARPKLYKTEEARKASIAARQRRFRAKTPLTQEQKTAKRVKEKIRQQSPEYKAKMALKHKQKQEMLAGTSRPYACEGCNQVPKHTGKNAVLHWDHCHTTGLFRGWLCVGCNAAIGHAKDDPTLLRRLADYLEASRVQPLAAGSVSV